MNKENGISDDELAEIIKAYLDAKEKNKNLLQYNLNIIDELHANENVHTRILLKILNYEDPKMGKIFLKDFIRLLNEQLNNGYQIDDSEISAYDIAGQFAYIDGYITSKKSAIIIENKINGAVDQHEQLHNYIKKATKKYSNEKIFVVYLTENGYKKPSETSFTKTAKDFLCYINEDNTGRFIAINYNYHILPFLRKCLEKTYSREEKCLKTALYQYIDYLEGRFNMRRNEMEYNEKLENRINSVLDRFLINKTKQERFNEIENIENQLISALDNIKKKSLKTIAEKITKYYEGSKATYKPFNKIRIWEDSKNVVVVFEDFILSNISYKLDVLVKFDSFKLTLKQENGKVINNIKIKDLLTKQFFIECTRSVYNSEGECEDYCELKRTLKEFFSELKELEGKE